MIMKQLTVLLLLSLFAAPSATSALFSYSAEVVLQGNDKQAETLARQAGLKEVLVRISGKEQTLSLPVIQDNLANVSQYINQVSYDTQDRERVAKYDYNSTKVLALLKKANASVWSEDERPDVLVWLLNVDENRIVWNNDLNPVVTELKAASARRGVPISLPLGDTLDLSSVTTTDILGGFIESIKNASVRYNPEGIVIAKIKGSAFDWQFFPSLEQLDELSAETGNLAGQSKQAINQMVNKISEFYANERAINIQHDTNFAFLFELKGVREAEDFYLAEKMLKDLNSVAKVFLKAVKKNTLVFELSAYDTILNFEKELTKHREMKPISRSAINAVTALDVIATKQDEAKALAQTNTNSQLDALNKQTTKNKQNHQGTQALQVLTYQWDR